MYFAAPVTAFHSTRTVEELFAVAVTPVGAAGFDAAETGTANDTAAITTVRNVQASCFNLII